MVYTRGTAARPTFQHMDDGEFGPDPRAKAKPVPPDAPPAITEYVADRRTVRSIDAYQLFLLLEQVMGDIVVRVPPEKFAALSPEIRLFFRPVRE